MERNVLIQRKVAKDSQNPSREISQASEKASKPPKFTLPEELFLLALDDKKGWTSIWNNTLSPILRASILVELGILGKIKLEPTAGKKRLARRNIIVEDSTITSDTVLDQVLKFLVESQPCTLQNWLDMLSGESWNPLKLKYHVTALRHRIAKNLVEKGVLRTDITNFYIFDLETHPLVNDAAKANLIKDVYDALTVKWAKEPQRMEPRMLALILLAHAAEVLEYCFDTMEDEVYDNITKRVEGLVCRNYEEEARKDYVTEILWGVAHAYLK